MEMDDFEAVSISKMNDAAAEDFPAVLVDGHLVHVCEYRPGQWQVWLNTEALEFDGLCIGVGTTRDAAVAQAVAALEAVVEHLQQPPSA